MVIVTSVERAMQGRWSPHSNTNFRTQFMGEDRHKGERPDPGVPSPIAYLVEQGPHTQLRAHFHEADQFQVFVHGAGRIGAHAAAPGLGHFVGPFSGYGPIVAGDAGLAYMTLRNAFDPGAQWLPDHIDRIRPHRASRREVVFHAPAPVDDAELELMRPSSLAPLIEPQPDGLAAWSCRVPPGGTASGPTACEGGGQFWLVMAGQMVDAAEGPLNRLSMAFVGPTDAPYVARAGAAGLHALVLQFPRFRAP
jgi:hypothetical protein